MEAGTQVTVRGSKTHRVMPQSGYVVRTTSSTVAVDVGRNVIEVSRNEVTTDRRVADRWHRTANEAY